MCKRTAENKGGVCIEMVLSRRQKVLRKVYMRTGNNDVLTTGVVPGKRMVSRSPRHGIDPTKSVMKEIVQFGYRARVGVRRHVLLGTRSLDGTVVGRHGRSMEKTCGGKKRRGRKSEDQQSRSFAK